MTLPAGPVAERGADRLPGAVPMVAVRVFSVRPWLVAAAVTVTLLGSSAAPAWAAGPPEGVIPDAGAPGTIPGSYLVVLDPSAVKSVSPQGRALAERFGGRIRRTFDAALNGYSVELSERQARRLAADPAVAEVVQNRRVAVDAVQQEPESWGPDRIDRRRLRTDDSYGYPDTAGRGVTAYVLDTGVLIGHQEFGGRASDGFNTVTAPGRPAPLSWFARVLGPRSVTSRGRAAAA
ncbi:S8 family serine peptidase [Kitasatospora sp. NBC_00315]|uniref:S8 family serine peptidase n=1 Tax=Kitasatospora sp. NBC_00315 TaxID=2975963 RepID=UPI0032490BE7